MIFQFGFLFIVKPRQSKLLTPSICVSFIFRSVGIFVNGGWKTIHLDFAIFNERLLAFYHSLIFISSIFISFIFVSWVFCESKEQSKVESSE